MESWLPFFVIVAAVAIVLQMAILLGMFLQVRQLNAKLLALSTDLHAKLSPILVRADVLLGESHGKVTSIMTDAAEITSLARAQVVKVDRVFTEAVDRMRLQIIRTDQILTGALETVEEAGAEIRHSLIGPIQQASAILKGVKAGLEFFRSHRGAPESKREPGDEGLFI